MVNMLSWLTGREDQTADPWPFQPQAEMRAYNPSPTERVGSRIQDLLIAGGMQAYPAGHVAHGMRDLLSMSPLGIGMSAADLLHAKSAGDPMGAAAAAIGMVPGLKPEVAAVRQGIRAYHGSPHDFDKFDIKRIGTGEGAQAYGHGLYFAENEGVAKAYRDTLADTQMVLKTPWGKRNIIPDKNEYSEKTAEHFIKRLGGIDEALAAVRNDTVNNPGFYPGVLQKLEEWKQAKAVPSYDSAGKMYEVNINAKPEQFLDWDKRLSQQSPDIQEGLRHAMGIDYYGKYDPEKGKRIWDEFQHADASRTVKQGFIASDDQVVSQRLNQAGIPGIRYLDQGSRTNFNKSEIEGQIARIIGAHGEQPSNPAIADMLKGYRAQLDGLKNQTSNYVLFNDQIVDIMRKYGLAAPAAAGAASYAMQPQEAHAGKAQAAQFQQPAPLSDRINQMIDSLQWGDQWQGRMRLPLQQKINNMLGESIWPPLR